MNSGIKRKLHFTFVKILTEIPVRADEGPVAVVDDLIVHKVENELLIID